MKKNIAILIPSCDKYSDMWEPFFFCLSKYWPDCPYKIYLLTNNLKPEFENVEVINIGEDTTWSSNVKKALNFIKEDYVFMWIDDLFLVQKVDTEKINKYFDFALGLDANYFSLNAIPQPQRRVDDSVGIIDPGVLYRVSTVLSLWKKEVLFDLLKEEENAWEFEEKGTLRADKYDKFFTTYKQEIKVINSVIKGVWRRTALWKLDSLGFRVDLQKREIFSLWQESIFLFKVFRSWGLRLFPSKYRYKIRAFKND
jgi:hypothetical protein